jgi:hypothetical protein
VLFWTYRLIGSLYIMESNNSTYNFAFTGASMKFHDFMRLANYVEENQIDVEEEALDPNVIMRRSNTRTNKREFQELIKRYKLLTPTQRIALLDMDVDGQKQIAMVAICKLYTFIRDFIVEVVREKFLALDFKLTDGDYQSFFNRKIELHPELEQFSESTVKKARQVTWRILEQAGLINNTKDRIILPQFVNQRVIEVIVQDNPALLKIFLTTDRDIKEMAS